LENKLKPNTVNTPDFSSVEIAFAIGKVDGVGFLE
jgi:hypothetical protein